MQISFIRKVIKSPQSYGRSRTMQGYVAPFWLVFFISSRSTELKFLIWTDHKIGPGYRAHMKRPLIRLSLDPTNRAWNRLTEPVRFIYFKSHLKTVRTQSGHLGRDVFWKFSFKRLKSISVSASKPRPKIWWLENSEEWADVMLQFVLSYGYFKLRIFSFVIFSLAIFVQSTKWPRGICN